jgi:PAS domain-containing protein
MRMVGVNIDVTDRQIAEIQRREIDVRLRKLAANLPGVLFQFKLRVDGTFCFPYASEGITELFGIAPERLQTDASSAFKAIHAEDRSRTNSSMLESARTLGV